MWARTRPQILHEMGCKIVAVSDVSGGLYNPDGLDIDAIMQHAASHPKHLLEGYQAAGNESLSNARAADLQCRRADPGGAGAPDHGDNAAQVQAQMIVEGANGPTTREADDILHDRGIVVVPDILANAGGVAVSYLEWVQDLQSFFWEEDEVNRQLHRSWSTASRGVAGRARASRSRCGRPPT